MPSLNAQAKFSSAPLDLEMSRSTFDRSFNYKATANAGMLNCFMVDEIYPGDTVDLRTTLMTRMTTPLFPVMDCVCVETALFFVPNRLVWDDWKSFMGENDVSQYVSSQEYLVPQTPVGNTKLGGIDNRTIGDLSHQMGIPYNLNAAIKVNGLYHRAYRLIWNEWFRDQQLQDPKPLNKTSTDNDGTYNQLLPVNRVHDYFGSCTVAPQRGEAVRIAIAGTAPVLTGSGSVFEKYGEQLPMAVADSDGPIETDLNLVVDGGYVGGNTAQMALNSEKLLYIDNMEADLSQAGIDVATLRLAVQSQRILEKLNLGSRYVEFVRNFFGVTSPDARQQRPELLAHSKQMLNMSDVMQTAPAGTDQTPLGTVGAYSKTFDDKCAFSHSFTEHGILMGLYWFRHNRSYSQGLNKIFSRRRFEDYYVPQLAHVGDMPVYKSELYIDSNVTASELYDEIFGYQEAWAELRYKQNVNAGLMDPSVSDVGKVWTYGDYYTAKPTLSDTWIQEGSAEVARTLAVTDEDQFLVDINVSFAHTRCLPVYSIPGLVDHF